VGQMANVSKWYQTVAMEVYLPFNYAIVFSLVYFRCLLPIAAPNCSKWRHAAIKEKNL
jgi:hypothetical protein